jgi:FtsP/CotA-like multicopper oxidase with cupredoxin domain
VSNKINSKSINKRKLLALALCTFVLIISIGTSAVGYTLAQNSSHNSMSNKLNPDKTAYNTTTSSSWEEHNATTPVTTEASYNNKEITLIAESTNVTIKNTTDGPIEVKAWTFNGTAPAPTLRFTEGDNITIHFINKDVINHTIHFHGNHDDKNDGVIEVEANGTYNYNITAEPAGALMYHCHADPTSQHIRMGMYGAMIIDPKEKPLEPAREFVMVMSEFVTGSDPTAVIADYYLNNGYDEQYMHHPLELNNNEMLRFYIINMGISLPYAFHLHSTTFNAYPSGLLSNDPLHVQTVVIAPGDASIVEAKWKYPGYYLFHSHGFQEERGNMGMVHVKDGGNKTTPLTESVSMFDQQYELQKKLQKPVKKDNVDTSTPIEISIVPGSGNPPSPNNTKFYDPPVVNISVGTSVRWTNDENTMLHTATSGNPDTGPSGEFDSEIIRAGEKFRHTFDKAGTFDYYCALHPHMTGQVIVR